MVLQAVLESKGFRVSTASNGANALACARIQPPDVVISDALMPVMDGFTLCRHWRADPLLQHIPFVLCSASYDDPRDAQMGLEIGADRYLRKPEDTQLLPELIRELLTARSAEQRAPRRQPALDDSAILRHYNEALIRKLEQKVADLDVTRLRLEQEIDQHKQAENALRQSAEQLRALSARLQAVREEERAGIARELHDELGQSLTSMEIDPMWLDNKLQTAGLADLPALRDKVAALVPRVEHLIETTQTISSALRPGMLDDLGLVAAIEWLASDFERRTGLACAASLPAQDIALDPIRAVALFCIVQEALTNVVRHAKATRVEIRLCVAADGLELEVRDNGRGITPQETAARTSLGLLSMRERAAVFGGSVDIQGEPGRGTTVRVRVYY